MSTFDITRIGPVALDQDELLPALDDDHFTVLGPCPGCWLWTLEYELRVSRSFGFEFSDVVEDIMQEHLEECAGLRDIVESLT